MRRFHFFLFFLLLSPLQSQASAQTRGGEESFRIGGKNIHPPNTPMPRRASVPVQQLLAVDKKNDLPLKVDEALTSLQSSLEETLYFWEEFPIVFPSSDFSGEDGEGVISMDQLFRKPGTINELRSLARHNNGERKMLSREQLKELRETGRFSVQSRAFPDEKHVWEVVWWLQRGSRYFHEKQSEFLGRWFQDIFSTTKEVPRIFSEGVRKINLRSIPDVLFGYKDQKRKFSPDQIQAISQDHFAQTLIEDLELVQGNLYKSRSTGRIYDFTLHDPTEWHKISDQLIKIESWLNSVWPSKAIQLRAEYEKIQEGDERENEGEEGESSLGLKGRHSLTNQEISDLLEQEKEKMLFARIQEQEHQHPIVPANLILENYRAMKIILTVFSKASDKLKKAQQEIRATVLEENPIRSRCGLWVEEQVEEAVQKEKMELENISDQILKQLEEEELHLHAYLFSRHLQWKQNQDSALRDELENILVPRFDMELIRYYWFPSSWEVTMMDQGKPTQYFEAKKYTSYTVSSGYPFWRLINCGIRMWTWWSNFTLALFVNLWCSPVSIRALFYPAPFYPYKKVNGNTGELEVDRSRPVFPYSYYLRTIWDFALESRQTFESQTNCGFLGKNVARFFNVLYAYVAVGLGGSLLLTVTYPPVIILNTLVSLGLLVLSPILTSLSAILGYLCCLLIYDFDGEGCGTVLVWCFKISSGLVEIFYAIGFAIVVPVWSSISTIFQSLFNIVLSVMDWCQYQLWIRPFAGIPMSDGFLIRRIAGPGLRDLYSYQISPEVVTLALHASLEQEESRWYQDWVTEMNLKPSRHFEKTMMQYFGVFGTVDSRKLKTFLAEKSRLVEHSLLQESSSHSRKQKISPFMSGTCHVSRLIRQEPAELRRAVAMAEQLCFQFFPTRLFPYLDDEDLKKFWVSKGLLSGDWEGLAKYHLRKIFGAEFLSPLARENELSDPYDVQEIVTLQIHHVDAPAFCKMILTGNPRDPMVRVSEVRNVITKPGGHNPTHWRRCMTGIGDFIPPPVRDVCHQFDFTDGLRFPNLFFQENRGKLNFFSSGIAHQI